MSKDSSKWGSLSAILVTIGVYFGAQIIAFALVIDQDEKLVVWQFAFIALNSIFVILLLWVFLRSRSILWSDIGLTKPTVVNILYAFPVFAVYFLVLGLIVAVIGSTTDAINVDQKQVTGFVGGTNGVGPLSLIFISLVVLPPLVEEILIRGFLYGGLIKKFSKIAAALIASVLFGIAHLQLGSGNPPLWIAAIDTFILSMFLIWLREKTGNLYAGMVVHALKNGVAFMALFIFHVS